MKRRRAVAWLLATLCAAMALTPTPRVAAAQAPYCGVALVLAVDISGSVDHIEFRYQMDGLADAIRAPDISAALVSQNARLALLQWSGEGRQRVSVPWRVIDTPSDVAAFADAVAAAPRAWRNFSTGVGEALARSLDLLAEAQGCLRKLIDVSGDGASNEGVPPFALRPRLDAAGVTVNGLAIEGSEPDVTGYYQRDVIHGPGAFVVTARDFSDYPRAIVLKLRRELLAPVVDVDPGRTVPVAARMRSDPR